MPLKQNGILKHIRRNRVAIMGLLEAKLSHQSLEEMAKKKLRGWKVANNFSQHPNGRILIIWKEDVVHLEIVEETDQAIHCLAISMFRFCKKLKALKCPFQSLNKQHFSYISTRAMAAEEELVQAQQQLYDNPTDPQLQIVVPELKAKALKLAEVEVSYCSQLAKAKYLRNSVKGTKFFHNLIKSKRAKSSISSITLKNGTRSQSSRQVSETFVQYYTGLLGTKGQCSNRSIVFKGKILDPGQAANLTRTVSDEEIRAALFRIGEDKAPGPDGFSSCFFKRAWDIMGKDFIAAVKEFFSSGQILKQINHSVLALIPKFKDADKVQDFRPIACYNVIYKELLWQYGRKRSSPRCILNVDLRKAIDYVDWDFIRDMLHALNFPQPFIGWIMSCISSTSYSLSYNGSLHGFFKGNRGLKINLSKSSFFSAGISAANLDSIKSITGFSQGSFPFRYLGALLSYAARTELIKSVLQGASGTPKAWNKALLSKTLWDIQAKKETLWVQWVHQIYMNRGSLWDYQNKHEDSPPLKQVIALRDEITGAEGVGSQIWSKIKSWLGISLAMQTIKAAVKWMIKEAKGTGFPAKIKRIALACTVYLIWGARNKSNFEGKIEHQDAIFTSI
ncbi:hypothetical protein Acr_11g0009610 [Actinidia rufa]|uniref:Uncharacterized protein n=1 Tax=Actinidia rufa TaxID=165716 RepID=A0A7J0FDB0_9ERIC|nr:hypothetical protein Acr_11g0009610 [Actinidia rufa]